MNRAINIIKSFWAVPCLFFVFLMLNDGYHHFIGGLGVDWLKETLLNFAQALGFSVFVFAVIYFSKGDSEIEK